MNRDQLHQNSRAGAPFCRKDIVSELVVQAKYNGTRADAWCVHRGFSLRFGRYLLVQFQSHCILSMAARAPTPGVSNMRQ